MTRERDKDHTTDDEQGQNQDHNTYQDEAPKGRWTKLQQNFESGVEKVRWFASILSERLKVEAGVIKLLARIRKLERKKDDLFKAIGEKVHETRTSPIDDISGQQTIRELLAQIDEIDEEIRNIKAEAENTDNPGSREGL